LTKVIYTVAGAFALCETANGSVYFGVAAAAANGAARAEARTQTDTSERIAVLS